MSNKTMIMKECERLNAVRNVYSGTIDYHSFFQKIRGDLMISGWGAGDMKMIADLIGTCIEKDNLPTVLLTSHLDLLQLLREKQNAGEITGVMISDPTEKNYHPFYGMSVQQILRFIRMVAEEMGYGMLINQVLVYAAAVLNVVGVTYPVSLPAMTKLLKEDDDFISSLALQMGLSNVIADNIRGNHEAGIVLRRVCERLEEIFEEVCVPENDTKYNFQSGAQGNVAVMGFYSMASGQNLMNCYLKEELFCTLKRVSRIRVVVDEVFFIDENDELLKYLLQIKRQGKIELIIASKNIKESFFLKAFDFENVVLFQHGNSMVTEEFSENLFGTYQYHFPVPVVGKPPAVLFTLKRDIHWQIATENRLRVRAEDMYGKRALFGKTSDYAAVKTTANDNIYLIETAVFLPKDGEIICL